MSLAKYGKHILQKALQSLLFNTVVFLCSNMLPLLLDSMTVRGVSGTSSVHQKVKGAPGVSHGVKGDVRGIQGGSGGQPGIQGGQEQR